MKFLVLSLFVCAASAATFPAYNKPFQTKAFASASVFPAVDQTVRIAPVARVVPVAPVVPVANVASVVASVPVVPTNVRTVVSDKDVEAVILRSDSEVNPDGYAYNFETSNGIAASSSGVLKKVNDVDTLQVQGQYQYISAEGEPISVNYVANEFGYQPDSAILPKAHPIPEAIARALEYIAAHPQKEEQFVRKN